MSPSPSEHDVGVVGVSIALRARQQLENSDGSNALRDAIHPVSGPVERQIGVGERDGEEAREVDDGVEKERFHGESYMRPQQSAKPSMERDRTTL